MSGPFKLKYKNSAFPFKGSADPTDIISAAESAYTVSKGTSFLGGFLKGLGEGLSKIDTTTKKKKKKEKDTRGMNIKMDPKQTPDRGYVVPQPKPKGKEIKIPGANKPTWEW